MTTRRQLLIGVGAGAFAAPLQSFAQPPTKIPRIGFLGLSSPAGFASRVEALRAGLRDFGYVEGKTIVIEWRWAEGRYERLAELAAELVRLKVDVIVTHGTPGTLAAKQATATMPIVMAVSGDAVATGLVASVARPGGNITGSTFFNPELAAKRLDLLKDVFPRARRVAVLINPDNPGSGPVLKAMEQTAKALKLELQQFKVRRSDEFEHAFADMATKRVDAVVIVEDSMIISNAKTIAELAVRKRLSSIAFEDVVKAGGLIGYGVSFPEMWRRAAFFVDKILKGTKPADIPIEQSIKFELVINRTTVKALGVTIPQLFMLRADKMID